MTLRWRHNGDDSVSNTSLTSVYSTVYSGADQSKHQSSASLAFVWGIHRGPVNSPHKWPVTRKMFPFDDVIMTHCAIFCVCHSIFIYTNEPDFRVDNKWQYTAHWVTTFCRFILTPTLLSGDRSQTLRDASNKLLNTHTMLIESQCNDGYPGSCGTFQVKYQNIIRSFIFYFLPSFSYITNCIFRPQYYTWEYH